MAATLPNEPIPILMREDPEVVPNVCEVDPDILPIRHMEQGNQAGSSGEHVKDSLSPSRPIWRGNLNVYWILFSGLGLWFLFIYTPFYKAPEHLSMNPRKYEDPFFLLHLIGAYSVYLICMWNTFHTPSHGARYCTAHVFLGRIAVAAGPIMFICGMICAWVPSYQTPGGLAKGLTGGGSAHMICSGLGYFCIRKRRTETKPKLKERYLNGHIVCMLAVFLPACGTPSAMRLAEGFGMELLVSLPVFIVVFMLFIASFYRAIVKQNMI